MVNKPLENVITFTYFRNIRMDLRVIGWGGVDWTHLAQDRASGGILWTR